MPVPGVLGFLAIAASAALAAVAAHWAQAIAAAAALVLLLVWIVLYTQLSAPINRQLTAAADAEPGSRYRMGVCCKQSGTESSALAPRCKVWHWPPYAWR